MTMSNYKLHKLNKKGRWFHANDTSFTDEYADERLDLFLRSSVVKKENGKYGNVYRLHAKEPHTVEMALDYDIGCPKCGAPFGTADQPGSIRVNNNQNAGNNHYNSRYEVRQAELREIDNLIYYFSQKAPEYEESAMLSDKLDDLERKLNRTPVAGIVFSSICGVFILLSVMLAVNHNSVYGFTAFLAFLTGIPAVIIMSVYLISMLINKPRYKKYRERFDVLNEELTRHYNDYGYCPVGIEYTNPNDLNAKIPQRSDGEQSGCRKACGKRYCRNQRSTLLL